MYTTLVVKKVTRKGNERVYYSLVDEKRVTGKVVQKYVGYLGKDPKSKSEVTFGDILSYVTRIMDLDITDSGIHDVLKNMGIDSNVKPIIKIVLENDRKLKKIFLRIR